MQVLCSKNGKVAYQGEHSMLDAAPIIPVIRRIIKQTYSKLDKKQGSDLEGKSCAITQDGIDAGVTNVFEDCWSDPSVLEAASRLSEAAKNRYYEVTHEYDCQAVDFRGYGKKFVKQAGFAGTEYAQISIPS